MIIDTVNHGYYELEGREATKVIYDDNSDEWLYFEKYDIVLPGDVADVEIQSEIELSSKDGSTSVVAEVVGFVED